jgi:hypothetical protein
VYCTPWIPRRPKTVKATLRKHRIRLWLLVLVFIFHCDVDNFIQELLACLIDGFESPAVYFMIGLIVMHHCGSTGSLSEDGDRKTTFDHPRLWCAQESL